MKHVLFICGKNRWRSPTAEQIFANVAHITCLSAGGSRDADVPVSADLIEWADLILVMEKEHQRKLSQAYQKFLKDKQVVTLGIPDRYEYMDPELVSLLLQKVTPLL